MHSRNPKRPLLVEFIGTTGVGKSTLIAALADALRRQPLTAWSADDLILSHFGLAFVRPAAARSLLLHLLSILPLFGYLCTWQGRRLLRLALGSITRSVRDLRIGFSLVRNVIKRIGCHLWLEEIRAQRHDCDIVLCDEGIVHAAHNLFVHMGVEPNAEAIVRFGRIVPKPDVLIWVVASPVQSAEVIRQRGHSRVRNAAAALAFAESAHATFATLARLEEIAERILVVDNSAVAPSERAATVNARATALAQRLKAHLTEAAGPVAVETTAINTEAAPDDRWAACWLPHLDDRVSLAAVAMP